jgi:hypothetical protein
MNWKGFQIVMASIRNYCGTFLGELKKTVKNINPELISVGLRRFNITITILGFRRPAYYLKHNRHRISLSNVLPEAGDRIQSLKYFKQNTG